MQDTSPAQPTSKRDTIAMLRELERKVLWLSSYMIHHANHEVDRGDGIKVGGHQASSASIATIMTALYFHIMRPEDRVAVKPHASPVFHAIQYMLGNQDLDKLKNFRGFGGAQSYPSRTKDKDDVDFSTGSVGLGVAITGFASLIQDYVHAKGWETEGGETWAKGRMIALMGDAEIDEGNIHEALLEYWKHGLTNTWWVVDYNRQSLDSVVSDQLFMKVAGLFENLGWEVVFIKNGKLQQRAFTEIGGDHLRQWIDDCPNQLYSALVFQGGEAWRKQLHDDLSSYPDTIALIDSRSDDELSQLMTNLGGHDLESLVEAFERAPEDKPVCFIAYTVKGFGLPLAGHKDNHAGLMTKAQMQELRAEMNINQGDEWDKFAGLDKPVEEVSGYLTKVPFNARGRRRLTSPKVEVPADVSIEATGKVATQTGFGKVLDKLARDGGPLADRIVTTSPDVTVSTNLGGWVNRRGLFSMSTQEDIFKERGLMSPQKWEMSPKGQHIELGIAEMNLFLTLAAAGLSDSLFGQRLIPVGTLYDPFISRGLDALNYACYQEARFILAGTPSGLTLAPEGGAHQSIATPLIGMSQDGLASFEPAYVDELCAIMGWAFNYVQRTGDEEQEQRWYREEKGGSVYMRLSTRPIEQISRPMDDKLRSDIIQGGYWLRRPDPSSKVAIVYMGAVAPEAIEAAGLLAEEVRGVGVLAVTSSDRLSAAWHGAQRARENGFVEAQSHIEELLSALPRDASLITTCDAHPESLSWLGGVCGHRVRALGVEHFGQSGSISQLYAHYHLDSNAILTAAEGLLGRQLKYRHN
ncbi:MAG: pyruvate dehydrogenase E1 component [Alphaproteobacteria bacterium]|jgi:pyruvate dehydrogenase E1 component